MACEFKCCRLAVAQHPIIENAYIHVSLCNSCYYYYCVFILCIVKENSTYLFQRFWNCILWYLHQRLYAMSLNVIRIYAL